MHADISRHTYDPRAHTLRVVQEQGALLVDADANEQTAALLHRLHTLARDLFGPFWGPTEGAGFKVENWDSKKSNFSLSRGRYYVNGLLCENDPAPGLDVTFLNQPAYPIGAFPDTIKLTAPFAVYLDVWEREVTEAELRATPGRIDPALQSLSPAPRTQLVWQVKVAQGETDKLNDGDIGNVVAQLEKLVPPDPTARPRLTARVKGARTGEQDGDYTGAENQLYRVEIHRAGKAFHPGDNLSPTPAEAATFKWSRDNGSVVFPLVLGPGDTAWQPDPKDHTFVVALDTAGRDTRTALKKDDWVEYIDPAITFARGPLDGRPIRQLFKVVKAAPDAVTLWSPKADKIDLPVLPDGAVRWAFFRRWDFHPVGKLTQPGHATGAPPADDGALLVVAPAAGKDEWLDLESGVQIRFEFDSGKGYMPGDYWLIPARKATNDVVWPWALEASTAAADNKKLVRVPRPVPATNTEHAYAPLAVIDPTKASVTDCRRTPNIAPLSTVIK